MFFHVCTSSTFSLEPPTEIITAGGSNVKYSLLIRRDSDHPRVTLLKPDNCRAFSKILVSAQICAVLYHIDQQLGVAVLAVSDKRSELNRVDVEGVRPTDIGPPDEVTVHEPTF